MTNPGDQASGGEVLPDWESYTTAELLEALEGLDRARYPERLGLIEEHLERRRHEAPRREENLPHYQKPPDWSAYGIAELEQALEGLDRGRYPEREETIRGWLERRRRKVQESNAGETR